jgi:hypothetical protein
MKRVVARTGTALAALGLGAALVLPATGVAGAQDNRQNQEGLVNVALQDTTIQVPIAAAVNICGVAVNILVDQIEETGTASCDAQARGNARR